MSEEEKFFSRWSRLKRKSPDKKAALPAPSPRAEPAAVRQESSPSSQAEEACEPFDLASLPAIESITADSDITGFLRHGVPAEFTKAALRRAWLADPAIRDFVGIAENQWDFTKPDTIHGFGPLKATDNVDELVARALGKSELLVRDAALGDPEPKPTQNCTPVDAPVAHVRQSGIENLAGDAVSVPPVHQPTSAHVPRHGKALPK